MLVIALYTTDIGRMVALLLPITLFYIISLHLKLTTVMIAMKFNEIIV